jgi:hypothetical protein
MMQAALVETASVNALRSIVVMIGSLFWFMFFSEPNIEHQFKNNQKKAGSNDHSLPPTFIL